MTTLVGAVLAAGIAVAETPQEIEAMVNYDSFTNAVNAENAKAVYDIAIANSNAVKVSWLSDLGLADKAKAYEDFMAKNAAFAAWSIICRGTKELVTPERKFQIAEAIVNDTDFKATKENAYFCKNLLVYSYNKELLCWKADATRFFKVCDKALDKKDYYTALAGLEAYSPGYNWAKIQSDEAKAWCEANIDEIINRLATAKFGGRGYARACFIQSIPDLAAKDYESAFGMKNFKPELYKDDVVPSYVGSFAVLYKFGREMLAAYAANTTDSAKLMNNYVNKLPANKRAEAVKKVADKLKKDPAVYLAAGIVANNVDMIIDALLASTDKLTAADVKAIIAPINAVDADYRKEDIAKVLRNINSKYTIKLYDDRDAWEPILSKIRAMLEVRQ